MAINSDKPSRWKDDIARSVDFYNRWFRKFAPKAYRDTRSKTVKEVRSALRQTDNLTNISPDVLAKNPAVLPVLRMATAPPLARDRLIGLAGVSRSLVMAMENRRKLPPRMSSAKLKIDLRKIGQLVMELSDKDILPWLQDGKGPREVEVHRAATVVADRLCGAVADPIIRNAQEQRQLLAIKRWLAGRGYSLARPTERLGINKMRPGTFAFRLNIPVRQLGRAERVNVPVDVAIMPKRGRREAFPLLIEAKSAGDFANTNKRRKEEATKVSQLRTTYGRKIRYTLFLCGYFDTGYLGYEAAEGIDWVWEHRIRDLAQLGI